MKDLRVRVIDKFNEFDKEACELITSDRAIKFQADEVRVDIDYRVKVFKLNEMSFCVRTIFYMRSEDLRKKILSKTKAVDQKWLDKWYLLLMDLLFNLRRID